MLAVSNAEGNSLGACVRNLVAVLKEGNYGRRAVLIRDRRCKAPGKSTADTLAGFDRLGGVYLLAGPEELGVLNAIYNTLSDVPSVLATR
ncbi:hypothetical protein FTUN_8863 [Frigoriglobus tundricola]|uniref:Uncharacterized protein n=2 Tax=Frigoriglobus tundricola TaxID=2774151 RepID=A0A6M5Z760_9BACT|nr:hypothetical protein FTUN_8863 [Frigoriglobus tundricola]